MRPEFFSLLSGLQRGWGSAVHQEADRHADVHHDQGLSNEWPLPSACYLSPWTLAGGNPLTTKHSPSLFCLCFVSLSVVFPHLLLPSYLVLFLCGVALPLGISLVTGSVGMVLVHVASFSSQLLARVLTPALLSSLPL